MGNATRILLAAALAVATATAGCALLPNYSPDCPNATHFDLLQSDCEDQGGTWVCEQNDEGCRVCDCIDPDREHRP
jgi:Spy/CpxP family protein refolding chaperone